MEPFAISREKLHLGEGKMGWCEHAPRISQTQRRVSRFCAGTDGLADAESMAFPRMRGGAAIAVVIMVVFDKSSLAAAAAAAAHPNTTRADAAYAGLQRYFFVNTSGFWKACGQNGGLGKAANNFDCVCEHGSSFCKNCFRWWMAGTLQALISLNEAVPGHTSVNTTKQLVTQFRLRSPYTQRAAPAWAYIDDYLWYVLMWLDVYRWLGEPRDLTEAADTFDLMWSWGADNTCGGIQWMYPDVDPRKNAITTLEALQAAAQLAVALKHKEPLRANRLRERAHMLWNFFDGVGLRDTDGLVHDNVTGTAHGKFACCNGSHAPVCKPRDTLTWTYNQGMFLGATVDMYALTGEAHYLALGARTLDAVVAKLTRGAAAGANADSVGLEVEPTDVGRAPPAGRAAVEAAELTTILQEAVHSLTLHSRQCDFDHDPSAPAGGDLFSFKAVFMQQLPRFVAAASKHSALTPAQLASARRLVADSSSAAWTTRVQPPFPAADICNEFKDVPAGAPPKFSWDWRAPPEGGALTCMDARTQSQALSVFVADVRLAQAAAAAGGVPIA